MSEKKIKLTPDEQELLRVFVRLYDRDGDRFFYSFNEMNEFETLWERARVRRVCRALSRKGLTEYRKGLWTEDGDMCGAGYGITKMGQRMVGD